MRTILSPEYHQLTEAEREAVHAWVRGHGIDPNDVPVDGIDIVGGQYRILVWQRTASGKRMADQLGGIVGAYEFRPAEPALPWPTRKTVTQPKPTAAPPIDGITPSGIAYRRGGPALTGGLQVAWDAHPDCPKCGESRGQRCVMVLSGRPHRQITPHRERRLIMGDADA